MDFPSFYLQNLPQESVGVVTGVLSLGSTQVLSGESEPMFSNPTFWVCTSALHWSRPSLTDSASHTCVHKLGLILFTDHACPFPFLTLGRFCLPIPLRYHLLGECLLCAGHCNRCFINIIHITQQHKFCSCLQLERFTATQGQD